MLFIGIDPGKEGGIAVLDDARRIRDLIPMPVVKAGRKGRPDYDLPVLRDLLLVWRHEGPFVTVEKLAPMPPMLRQKGGAMKGAGTSIVNYQRGVSRGWEWMLVALKIPYQVVAPQSWQRAMLDGISGDNTKQRSILAAKQLFPTVDLRRPGAKTKLSDGLSDALLLAEYGRRKQGGMLFPQEVSA